MMLFTLLVPSTIEGRSASDEGLFTVFVKMGQKMVVKIFPEHKSSLSEIKFEARNKKYEINTNFLIQKIQNRFGHLDLEF